MTLGKLTLYNFRSYAEREFEFSPEVTVIVGKNGVGKTNILEAIYVLLQGKSFRDSDEQLICHGESWWKITGECDQTTRELRYQLGTPGVSTSKQLLINNASKGRFSYKHQLPVVLFEPDDLLIIHGSPSLRRQYLDVLLLKTDPEYRQLLAKYERALLQRNNLLKKKFPLAELRDKVFVWDIALSEYGSDIQQRRLDLVTNLNKNLGDVYSRIAGKQQLLTMAYHASAEHSAHLATQLAHNLERDVLRGFTGVGPHRDDVEFMLGARPAKTTASRGEVRTIILALKQLEVEHIVERRGSPPLFLLDDVFSELDETRQKSLLTHTTDVQKIITTTHTPDSRGVQTILLK